MAEQYETVEQTIARLNQTVKPCEKHNSPAALDEEGAWIVADPCGCVMLCTQFDSVEEAIAFWNERPYVESLMADYIQEVTEGYELTKRYRVLRQRAVMMALLLHNMQKNNSVSITDLTMCMNFVPTLLQQCQAEEAQELQERKESMQRMVDRLQVQEAPVDSPSQERE